MLVPWDNDSTWNNVGSANDGVNPTTGDEASTAELTFTTGAVGDIRTLDVTASVRFWHTNGGPNYGWSMHDTGDDGYQFNSSEATTVSQRPRLTVNYVPSGATNPVAIVTQPAASDRRRVAELHPQRGGERHAPGLPMVQGQSTPSRAPKAPPTRSPAPTRPTPAATTSWSPTSFPAP